MSALWEGVRSAFHRPETRHYRIVQTTIWLLIAFSVALLFVELAAAPAEPWASRLQRIDIAVLWFFGFELILRVMTFRPRGLSFYDTASLGRWKLHLTGRLRYCLRPLVLIDILTVAALVPALRGLRVLRLMRLFRTIRVFRYSNPFRGLERAFRDNTLLFAFAFSTLAVSVLIGGVSLYLIEADRNRNLDSLGDGMWWALVTLTTVGFGDISPVTTIGRLVGSVLMIAGMFNLALFAGIVGRTLLTSVFSMREEQFRMSGFIDHVVICGFDTGAAMLLDALRQELDADRAGLVIFAPGERPGDLPPEFMWVQGDPTKESELDKARITHAKAALVVAPRDVPPHHADATTIMTLFTLRSYLEGSALKTPRRRPLYLVAEILDAENVDHARTAGADEVIETTRLGFSLLAHAIKVPGTAAILSKVASTGANSLFVGKLPAGLTEATRFADVACEVKKAGGLLLGVRDPRSRVNLVNPDDEYLVDPSAHLIYLAEMPVLGPLEPQPI
ncbi:MAG: ion transporter [Acidobacteriota bacterium]